MDQGFVYLNGVNLGGSITGNIVNYENPTFSFRGGISLGHDTLKTYRVFNGCITTTAKHKISCKAQRIGDVVTLYIKSADTNDELDNAVNLPDYLWPIDDFSHNFTSGQNDGILRIDKCGNIFVTKRHDTNDGIIRGIWSGNDLSCYSIHTNYMAK